MIRSHSPPSSISHHPVSDGRDESQPWVHLTRVCTAGMGVTMPFTVTQHDGVCSPTFDAQGSCARGVMSVVGDLLFAQLLSSAFVSSSFGLVMETSTAKHAKSTAKSMLRRSLQRGSRAEEDEDTEEVTELDLDVAEGEIIMYVAPRQPHSHA